MNTALHSCTRRTLLFCLMSMSFVAFASTSPAKDRAEHAREFKTQLTQKVMPYWYDTTLDAQHGGYLLSDYLSGPRPATEKQLVSQSRMVWGFSLAHRKGYSDAGHNYLKAAESGYSFLLDHFLDKENGGYYWQTDRAGKVTNNHKVLYGESFVIYAFVEYYRASGNREALRHAMDLYEVIQKKAHDAPHDGWFEHCDRDWTPFMTPGQSTEVEVSGYKSANAHLHWMEALTELYEATHDANVKQSLAEAIRINATYFYPPKPGQSAFHRLPDWKPVMDPKSAGLSYGHNVEFAWLMIRAETVLGKKPSWDHFDAELRHALAYGYDHQRGGLYSKGTGDQQATDTEKVWWVQAEMLAALTDALKHKPDAAYAKALDQLLAFITTYQTNPADGIWIESVTAEGKTKSNGKAHNWKANYHDVRAIQKFIEAFGS